MQAYTTLTSTLLPSRHPNCITFKVTQIYQVIYSPGPKYWHPFVHIILEENAMTRVLSIAAAAALFIIVSGTTSANARNYGYGNDGGYSRSYGSSYGTYSSAPVHVNSYTRSDGTFVQSHYRTAPNYSRSDNWSSSGNYNPYTGAAGTRNPYSTGW